MLRMNKCRKFNMELNEDEPPKLILIQMNVP